MSILVTGGAGFIGSNFILNWLSGHDETVINLDALTYAGQTDNLAELSGDPRYIFVRGNICDSTLLAQLLSQHRPRYIVHFAAESHVDRSISGAEPFIQSNIVGTFRLLEATRTYWGAQSSENRNAFRFLHVSTDEVYGTLAPQDAAFCEDTPYAPNSPYAASKAASDHLVRAWHATHGLPVLTTNCSNNYGPRQFPEKLIPLMISHALAGKDLPVYGDGMQVRDWLYVEDHCRAIERVLEAGLPGETYNIGGACEVANIDIVKGVCRRLDGLRPRSDGQSYAVQIRHVTDRPGHDRRYAIDARKIRRELGWSPAESFETGFEKTIRWYLQRA